jgi:hypothetical protein
VTFQSPSGHQQVFAMLSDLQRVSGWPQDGVVSFQMIVPQSSEPATWTVRNLLLVDQMGNTQTLSAAQLSAAGFPTTFTQTGI